MTSPTLAPRQPWSHPAGRLIHRDAVVVISRGVAAANECVRARYRVFVVASSRGVPVMTAPTPASYVNGFWPGSLVLQKTLFVSLTVPLAWTVTLSPLATSAPVPWTTVRRVVAYPGIGAKADMRLAGEVCGTGRRAKKTSTKTRRRASTVRWIPPW